MKWWLFFGVIACGDNTAAPPTAEPRSGSRLRLHVLEYADGTRQLASTTTVEDAERGEPCTIKQWSDGLRYCTPDAYRAVFIDATCTREAARRRSVEAHKLYALHEFAVAGTALPSRLYRLGAEIPRAEITNSFELRGTDCIARSDNADKDHFFELGDEIDRAELVHTSRAQIAPAGLPASIANDRLVALVDLSDDGLQLPTALFDTVEQHACRLSPREDGTLACEPDDVITSATFADRACTMPAIVVNASVAPPDLTRRHHGVECDTFHPLGDVVLAQTAYTKSGDVCTEAPLGLGDRVFSLAPPIELPTIERHRVDEQRRLQLIEVGDGFPDPFAFDTELGQECTPSPIRNELRCLPPFERPRNVFSDSTCDTAAITLEIGSICGSREPAIAQDIDGNLFPVLEPAVVYERSTAKICTPALPAFGGVFHRIGTEIPRTAFISAQQIIE